MSSALRDTDDRLLYNSRIIDSYIKLLEKKYTEVDTAELLRSAGMEPYEVADQGSWFSQKQINRFHEKLSEVTSGNIAREAGRFSASPEALGITRQYILGQANLDQVYTLIGMATRRMTRSNTTRAKKIASNTVEITVTFEDGVQEEPFQCEYRMGVYESIAMVFTSRIPKIEHEDCIFKGAGICRYVITWEKTRSASLKRIRNTFMLLSAVGGVLCGILNPALLLYALLPVAVGGTALLSFILDHHEKKELKDSLSEVFDATNALLDQINENYNNALMTQEFGQAISRHSNVDDILKHVVQILENRLDYDRGMILLANSAETQLEFHDGFGYTSGQLERLEQHRVNLDKPDRRGVLVVSYREQRSFLINDIDDIEADMTPRSREWLKDLGSQAFICCPITCDGESLGVLVVDNLKSKRALVKSDLNFLMGFAPVIGTSIRNEEEKKTLQAQLLVAQRLESLGTMAGGVAHDFNNLLMGIQGRTAIMLINKTPDEKDYEHLKGIEEYVKSAANLTKQLLGFARGGKYEVKPTNMNTILQKQNQMFGRTMKEVRIHEKYEEDLWIVDVDRSQLEQVLMNLYVNAWQAMPTGGDLYIQTNNIDIGEEDAKLHQTSPGRFIKISVTDTGIGMDEDTRQQIFVPFFTTKQMGRGTGLGLASTYGIVTNHNGFITVYSEVGEGTSFNLYLPAVFDKEAVQIEELPKTITRGTETILLVDDEDFILDVGRDLLSQLGYKVEVAKGGNAAIDYYSTHYPSIDVVIVDMIMPDLSGGKVFDRLREIDPEVKVLLSSGYSIDGQATEILKRGCNGFIQKPFTATQLSRKLREILGPE